MRITLLVGLAAGALLFVSLPAHAFPPNQSQIAAAQATLDDVVEVRHKVKRRPPGWSRGKAWWKRGGRGVPPGHRR